MIWLDEVFWLLTKTYLIEMKKSRLMTAGLQDANTYPRLPIFQSPVSLQFEHESKSCQITGFDNSASGRGHKAKARFENYLNSMVFWVQTQIASKCYWKPVTYVNQPICMENAHQQLRIVQLCTYLFRQVYCPQMISETRNHEKIVLKDMYWNWQSRLPFRLLWKRKPKIKMKKPAWNIGRFNK